MEFSAGQIAEILEGRVEGNKEEKVNRLAKIEEGEKGSLTFLANPQYEEFLYSTQASLAIVNEDFSPAKELPKSLTLIRVADAYQSFARLLEYYNHLKNDKKGIEEGSFVDPAADLGEDVYVGAFAYISRGAKIGKGVKIYPQTFIGDDAVIGEGSVIYPGCKIYSDTIIGKQCVIHAGAVLGADGFGFAPNSENSYNKVAQIGNVVIEDHVEIGANTCIDRATLGSTVIKKGVKLDNLIQIAHNVEVGENTVLAAQVGIAGSTKLGKNVMMGGQVGVMGHLNIPQDVKVAAQTGIGGPVKKEGAVLQGSPAMDASKYQRSYVAYRRLPELMSKISQLEKEIEALKNQSK